MVAVGCVSHFDQGSNAPRSGVNGQACEKG
jgi:hypothetical protein